MSSNFVDLPKSYPPAPVQSIFGRIGDVVATFGDYVASLIGFTPSGTISATNVQTAIAELDSEKVSSVAATLPLLSSGGTSPTLSIPKANTSTNGYLSAVDWTTFNNKLESSLANYISNSNAEIDTNGINLYSDIGRTVPASVIINDLTFTAVASGDAGNGININYIFHASQSYLTPLVTVVSPTQITVAWYNGPTIANNPTATQLKAAFDGVAGAVAIATCAITGTAGNRQYITGSHLLANGGDTSPVDGTGGSATGVTLIRSTVDPLVGNAEFLLSKDANNREGDGISTDFTINSPDKGNTLQVSFYYSGGSGFTFGNSSDVRVFIYDITNNALISLTRSTLTGPTTDVAYRFAGQFVASETSVDYRLILHIATTNSSAWDLKLDSLVVTSILDDAAATEVPQVVLPTQPITGAVTDHMAVMWLDGNTAWQPATMASGSEETNLHGFAVNIVGLTADIVIKGALDGFSVGPFLGYNQYVDTTAGGISPLPSPFTDTGVTMGKGVSTDTIYVNPKGFRRLVTSKGGLLTNAGANNGTGDQVLAVGGNGTVPVANSAASLGIQWLAPIVATTPFTFTAATRTLTIATATGSVAGALSAADFTTFNAKAGTASPTFTGTPTLPTGTIGVTQSAGNSTTALATTAFVTTADNLKANLASPTFTGTPTLPTGTIAVTQAAANSTTAVATTAFATTADNLKANIAAPTFTGDVNSSTGNVLISTLGKGLQVKTGTNSKINTAVLVGGTVTVSNTSVTANSRIFVTSQTDGGTPGWLRISAKTNATSFVITSSSVLDTSTVAWCIIESIP